MPRVHLQNDDDFVCAIPPTLGLLAFLLPSIPPIIVENWAKFAVSSMREILYADGSHLPSPNETITWTETVTIVAAAVAGAPLNPATSHYISAYVRRLQNCIERPTVFPIDEEILTSIELPAYEIHGQGGAAAGGSGEINGGGSIVGAGGIAVAGEATLTPGGEDVVTGTILAFAGASIPTGYLNCDGSDVSRTTYAALFAAIGIAWGAGDGVTTFTLPDLRGRAVIGVGTGPGLTARALADDGGEETHVLTTGELATHKHNITDPGHKHFSDAGVSGPGTARHAATSAAVSASVSDLATSTGITMTLDEGSNVGHNTMQPWAAANWIIKV
jgi:microcystin-dependent protein